MRSHGIRGLVLEDMDLNLTAQSCKNSPTHLLPPAGMWLALGWHYLFWGLEGISRGSACGTHGEDLWTQFQGALCVQTEGLGARGSGVDLGGLGCGMCVCRGGWVGEKVGMKNKVPSKTCVCCSIRCPFPGQGTPSCRTGPGPQS